MMYGRSIWYPLIDNKLRYGMRSIIYKARRGIHQKRGSYYHENICIVYNWNRILHYGYRFFEPYDMRTKLHAVGCGISPIDITPDFGNQFRGGYASHLENFPMKMPYCGRTCPFMQVIDILRDDRHVKIFFQFGQPVVGGIG